MWQTVRRIALMFVVGGLVGCASTPWFSGLDADGLYAEAQSRVQREDWGDAVEALERFLIVHPTDPRAADARLLLARAFGERGEHLSASSEYLRFMERHPTDARAGEASLGICRAYEQLSPNPQRDQAYTRQAVTFCQNVTLDFPGSPQADEAEVIRDRMLEKLGQAEFDVGQFYLRLGALDSAVLYFERVVDSYPATRAAPNALLELHGIYVRLEWTPEAEEVKERLLNLYPNSEAAREIGSVP